MEDGPVVAGAVADNRVALLAVLGERTGKLREEESRGTLNGEENEHFCAHADEMKDGPETYGSDGRTGPLKILEVGRPFEKGERYWVHSY